MKLVFISALIAVCGAAKLDRAYLPPASAKTAGGSPGSLQAPLQNSFNHGIRTVPKGSYTNDFQGVVVDAPAAGTKSSGESGLGAPRTYYGSINSKVGEAAFTSDLSAFRQSQAPTDNEETTSFDQRNQFKQGNEFSQRNQFNPEPRPERPQAAQERAASILRYDSEVGPESYSYSFETDNGISAEENGVATNGVQAQGGFSYTGDDGKVYTITYTADEGGYQPKGDHLPTPPPIPEEILKALELNARDEAAGINDDGSYDPQKYNAQGDYAESDSNNSKYNDRQSNQFGNNEESDATASGSFVSQDNRSFARPGSNRQSAQSFKNENSGVPKVANSQKTGNRFVSTNEYLPPLEQNTSLNSSESNFDGNMGLNTAATNTIRQAQQNVHPLRPHSLSKPTSSFTVQPTQKNEAIKSAVSPLGNNADSVGQRGQFGFNKFGSRNEYLPPFKQASATNNDNILQRPTGNAQASHFQARPQNTFSAQSPSFVPGSYSNNNDDNSQINQFAQSATVQSPSQSRGQMKFNGQRPNTNNINLQKATSQPDTELTTPFESEASSTQHIENLPSSTATPNERPAQNQFGFKQSNRPIANQGSASAFASFSSNSRQSTLPQRQKQFNQQTSAFLQNGATEELQIPVEIQYPTTTRRPFNRIQQQTQGQDDSYYYNQPSRAFNVPNNQNQMRFPSAPSSQFSSFRKPAVQNVPQKPAANPQNNFSTLQSPIVVPSPPRSSVETGAFQGTSPALNGITQASASAFAQSSQFGRRPSVQQSPRKFNSQAQFQSPSQQAQSETQTEEPVSQFAQQLENEDKFEPLPQNQESQETTAKPVFNQQYQGEIYEYTKPAETLPAPTNKSTEASAESAKPETDQSEDVSRNQFVAQFVQGNEPESQTQSVEESKAEIAPVPLGMAPLQDIRRPSQSLRQQVNQNQRPNSCCRQNADNIANQKEVQPSFPSSSNNQFTAQSSAFVGTQGPKLVKASSVAGRGEIFGGPRKTPNFDSESGYHY